MNACIFHNRRSKTRNRFYFFWLVTLRNGQLDFFYLWVCTNKVTFFELHLKYEKQNGEREVENEKEK